MILFSYNTIEHVTMASIKPMHLFVIFLFFKDKQNIFFFPNRTNKITFDNF